MDNIITSIGQQSSVASGMSPTGNLITLGIVSLIFSLWMFYHK